MPLSAWKTISAKWVLYRCIPTSVCFKSHSSAFWQWRWRWWLNMVNRLITTMITIFIYTFSFLEHWNFMHSFTKRFPRPPTWALLMDRTAGLLHCTKMRHIKFLQCKFAADRIIAVFLSNLLANLKFFVYSFLYMMSLADMLKYVL